MPTIQCRIKDYIQPFERELALQEMRALCHGYLRPIDGSERTASLFSIEANGMTDELRNGLTYWRSVGTGREDLTLQVRGEATAMNATSTDPYALRSPSRSRNFNGVPRRRCLRYATHGMHEYRGKFFPQLARALINIAEVPSTGIVVDPMCGSGTTLVEARLAGRLTYGLDMNPLSVFVARVKCHALSLSSDSLRKAYRQIQMTVGTHKSKGGHHTTLCATDQNYLRRWFATSTLQELDHVYSCIQLLRLQSLREFFLVCLSNVLRSVSWQRNDDLRVRKQMTDIGEGEVLRQFLGEACRSVSTVSAFTSERGRLKSGGFGVLEADARAACDTLASIAGGVDVVITSPPYATALPYIDTDRLSLVYLDLLARPEHSPRERLMIGNREISTRTRAEYWTTYEAQRSFLPVQTRQVIDRINQLNDGAEVGFRKKNLAALLSKYFFDMREVLFNIRQLLRSGGDAFLVVGDNRTTAGGELIQIHTADHLTEIAKSLDFTVVETLSMEMLPSRDIFRKNAVSSEKIIRLKAP